MKNLHSLLLLLILAQETNGQNSFPQKDTFYFQQEFIEYKIDSCLIDLLWDIVENDSGNVLFPPDVYFYNLSYSNLGHYRQMMITPSIWYQRLPSDCNGLIRVGNMSFLCFGSISKDSLFTATGNAIEIKIKNTIPDKYLNRRKESDWYDWEKSPTALVGQFNLCNSPPLNIYINVGKKLIGYNAKVK